VSAARASDAALYPLIWTHRGSVADNVVVRVAAVTSRRWPRTKWRCGWAGGRRPLSASRPGSPDIGFRVYWVAAPAEGGS